MGKKHGKETRLGQCRNDCLQLLKIGLVSASLLLAGASLNGQTMDETKCARIAKAVVGLNYERSSPEFPDHAQIWRFQENGELSAFRTADFIKPTKAKPGSALWKFGVEDHACTLKVAAKAKPNHWTTYRLRNVTWAIVRKKDVDQHVPDFEDHTGMRMRFCGTGEHCKTSLR